MVGTWRASPAPCSIASFSSSHGAGPTNASGALRGSTTARGGDERRKLIIEAPALPRRIPALDGLRAVAIVLVVMVHAAPTAGFPPALAWVHTLQSLGVRVFFVISGFLITALLLQERAATGGISLRRFYMRRALRIFPAFYAYLAVIAVLAAAGWIILLPGDLAHALTYTMNYHFPGAWEVLHFWSLSVEEQFYLLWPPLLVLAGPRRACLGAAAVVVITPLIRIAMWYGWPVRDGTAGQFQMVADSLAVGCLLAGSYNWLGRQGWYIRLLTSRWFLLVPLVVLATNELHWRPRTFLMAQTITHIAIGLCLDRCVRIRSRWTDGVLNSGPARFAGALSYSLYLWQQPFLTKVETPLTSFPLNVVLAVACALASYHLVEQPFLRFKDRLSERTRPPARAIAAPT